MRKWPLCERRQACWSWGVGVAHTICCKVEMTLALSKMEANLESALESWRQVGGLKEWGETLPPHFPITSSKGIKETPVV